MNQRDYTDSTAVRQRPVAQATPETEQRISLLRLLNVVIKRRATILAMAGLTLLVTSTALLLQPRTYSSSGALMPQGTQSGTGELGGIAAQLGLNVNTESDQSSQFYADLMQSRTILGAVADSAYATPTGSQELWKILGIEASDPGVRREATIARLRSITSVAVDRKTGMVRYQVATKWPALSRNLAVRWAGEMNDYNVRSRRERATAEQEFIRERATQAHASLQQAENNLKGFLERNRTYSNDPELVFAHDRLQRDVTIREQVYLTLTQSLEQVAITSSRSTPTITIVEHPNLPASPNPRGLLWRSLVALAAGTLFGVLYALGREFIFRRDQQDEHELAELYECLSDLRSDLRHPVRAFGAALARGKTRRSA